MKSILIASDHAGFNLKEELISYLQEIKLEYTDFGCSGSDDNVDYPDIAKKLCNNFDNNQHIGILICGSGIGMSIAANRLTNIRAALCHNEEIAALSRRHNNANILCLGARIISKNDAIIIVKTFLETAFENGRHQIRVEKLS